jgi:hypothetical protein
MRLTACLIAVLVVIGSDPDSPQVVRDAGSAGPSIGTASVIGIVVDAQNSPQPLRRAIVTVSGTDLTSPRSVITNDDGRFELRRLPAGRLTVTAAKPGYVNGAFGATRPGRRGTPVEIAAGETGTLSISLARGAALTGAVRSDTGQPLGGMRVFAMDADSPASPHPAPEPSQYGTTALTDERGVYRLYNLAPGEYMVAAIPTTTVSNDVTRLTVAETDAILARLRQRQATGVPPPQDLPPAMPAGTLAPMFYPGTPAQNDAGRVKVASGEVRAGLDITWAPVPTTTIEGMVAGDGQLPSSVQLSIASGNTVRFFALGGANPQLVQPPGRDGRFRYSGIVPGRYTIVARASAAAPSGGREGAPFTTAPGGDDTQYAVESVEVTGQPVTGVTLRLQRGSRVAGRIVFDAGKQKPTDFATIRVGVRSVGGGSAVTIPNVTPAADGRFAFGPLPPGAYVFSIVTTPGAGSWWFRSAMKNGRDVLDAGVALRPGEDHDGFVLTLTDKRSEIFGTLWTAAGQPASAYYIVAVPADAAFWTPASRRVKSTRPGTDGAFSVLDLPAGDYLLVTLTDVEPADLQRRDFLSSIAPAGVKVTLGLSERKRQDLRIGKYEP